MKRILSLFFTLLLLLPVGAQIRGNNITVSVQPDHRDWNYKTGEKATFRISVLKSGTTLPGARIDLEAGPVMYPDVKKSLTLKEGETQWTGSMSRPVTEKTTKDSARQASRPSSFVRQPRSPRISTLSGSRLSTRRARFRSTRSASCCPSAARMRSTSMR